ncbi:MAG: histidine kinase [Gammaproteobacteria bacterium]|uniref:ATP-binding protein n=1 Tax=Rhodoferax sp. TaxID=50421 RepID=UPI001804ED13|nr:ATP-binding protein [Rhodoferax sp.]MBU3900258.1 histidine kinase [Gammaproteobacteria bacterium]MBA3057909.1 histidine kinase [Rhodoferax sp.]MBU3997956.1 histidine kinase [Gammaproteobacteria bacterium]MBU4079404.1 histidine kinase [Gammaproteobacteria bacterium]MBU4111692.1 histidine kinase [Gammaproteobacteria bacterium]
MSPLATLSIRSRLIWGAALVLLAFLAGAGWAVQQAHTDSVRAARFARLQASIYLLMAGAELDAQGALLMPVALAEPRLSVPASGLYANIANVERAEDWQSASTLGLNLPFQRQLVTGEWRFETVLTPTTAGSDRSASAGAFLAATYAVKWSDKARTASLVFSVLEDKAVFDRELAVFERTLWRWLGGTGLLLLLTQTLLLRWALAPLVRMTREIHQIEQGEQTKVEGRYPRELAGLTHSLNTLIDQERSRQTRYKHALDDLAHSLKTPLAVLHSALADPGQLPTLVTQQVSRMDDIVRHQLGRAGASGAALFAPQLALAPVLTRIGDSLAKVYVDKQLVFALDCPPELRWRIDEGDAFEMLGNVMDNAAKWARRTVTARLWLEAGRLHIRVLDDGPGFGDRQAVLQRRVRLDEQVPGHGIGLAVVSDLVASHQGELTLSRAESGGAQLDIVLPAV